jgi:hypothetical protein
VTFPFGFFPLSPHILKWNLCCRSDNLCFLNLAHLKVVNDAIVVTLWLTKTNRGADTSKTNPKTVYCNPFQPEICPILAIAVYVG